MKKKKKIRTMSSDKVLLHHVGIIATPADRHSRLGSKAQLHLHCSPSTGAFFSDLPYITRAGAFNIIMERGEQKVLRFFPRSFSVLNMAVILQPNPGFKFLQQKLANSSLQIRPSPVLIDNTGEAQPHLPVTSGPSSFTLQQQSWGF